MTNLLVVVMFLLFCALVVSGAGLVVAFVFLLFDKRGSAVKGRDASRMRAGSRAALRRYVRAWMASAAVWSLVYLALRLTLDV